MGYEEEDARRAAQVERQQEKRAAYIKADIAKRGIEAVLADIVRDPGMYRNWSA